ncbi:hypothetical protein Back2_12960 [Nocardioides baekrokdamisoli]|uniref:Glycosyl transferase family 1 domain-containing protein n=1 Tax=Nocardioides baekrokdamisoli TaxID=1804624 RepID=A0A3G9J1Z2_9ACTN|nr:glycosyltransferase [Nocardioides baekrokdamisoli]BBH17009.1 hypothetical protein Back2_12960 [Nocardioides baekrokdamisoli]
MVACTAIVASHHGTRDRALATIVGAMSLGEATRAVIVDLDGTFRGPVRAEIRTLAQLAEHSEVGPLLRRAYATLPPHELPLAAAALAALAEPGDAPTVLLGAGVVVTGSLNPLVEAAGDGIAVIPRADASQVAAEMAPTAKLRADARRLGPVPPALRSPAALTESVVAIGSLESRRALAAYASSWRTRPRVLDLLLGLGLATAYSDPERLLAARRHLGDVALTQDGGRLWIDGRPVVAVDATAYDPQRPWLLDGGITRLPSWGLAGHPAVGDVLRTTAAEWGRLTEAEFVDRHLRVEARRADVMGEELPDLLAEQNVSAWACEMVPGGHRQGVARYLAGVRALRPDLLRAFPEVPGADSERLALWALGPGLRDGAADASLLRAAAEETRARLWAGSLPSVSGGRTQGVNLVGYLAGGLGLGESARLTDSALVAAGEPTTVFDVSHRISSSQDADVRLSPDAIHDISLLCVNGLDTPRVVAGISEVVRDSYRIGMWYWEFAEFPPAQAAAFAEVDEVWAPTDFIRDALASASPGVPVVTMMPPLPQRPGGAVPPLPGRFGIDPKRPWFLFSFDYFSRMVRKNPLGLIDAFVRAFPEVRPRGPQLVIKTMNGDSHPVDAEQLRVACAARPDLILIEEYLPHAERHVLVAHCTAYVSLHRAEGLGLTVAEAMAWGRPVVTTAYGGPMQFTTPRNSYQVGWTPDVLSETVGPYVAGLPWASPDLDEAARILREIVAHPWRARRVGRRAARDIGTRHTHLVAGEAMRSRLQQIRAARAAGSTD